MPYKKYAFSPPDRDRRSLFPRSVSSRNGTSVRTPISRQTSVISDHIRLFHGATAPSSMLIESSGTSESRSTVRTLPVPPHLRQAPWELNASSSARRCMKMFARIPDRQVPAPPLLSSVGSMIMSIRTAVGCQSGIHQPQTVQKFGSCSKRTADPRHSRTLMECQSCRDIQHLVHLRFCRSCHTPSCISGK